MKPLLCSSLLLLAFSVNAQAPTPVPIPKEPHHHLVLENEYVRVFRVSVPAHEPTLLHQHDVPYVYVALGPADVINAVQGKPEAHLVMADGQVGYSRGGFAHVARNESATPFNNVTVELLHPQGEPQNLCAQVLPGAASGTCQKISATDPKGYSIEPQVETAEVKLDLVRLDPKAMKSGKTPEAGVLIVMLDKTELQIDTQCDPPRTLTGGKVMWLNRGSYSTLSNAHEKASSYLQLIFKEAGKP